MTRALLIPAEGSKPAHEIEVISLKDYQAAVGGWIEVVPLAGMDGLLVLNEEGKLMGFGVNHRATEIASIFPGDYIAGDALVVGPSDAAGRFTDYRHEDAFSAWREE